MTDRELEARLKAASSPVWPPEYWEAFPCRVTAAQKTGERLLEPKRRFWQGSGLALACAALLLCVFSVFIGLHRASQEPGASRALLQNEKMLREILTLFPNRVRAIVRDA